MTHSFSIRQLLVAILSIGLLSGAASRASAGTIVSSGDFLNDVYELRYYPKSQTFVKNGTGNFLSHQNFINQYFLQNIGDSGQVAWQRGDLPNYLMAGNNRNGFYGGQNSVYNLNAAATMGWDFSSVNGKVQKVELISRNPIFQFAQWVDEAFNDTIYGQISTPGAFGAGPYSDIYRHTGNNTSSPSALITDGVIDLTGFLSTSWLDNPSLLELKFGYDLANRDIPGRHIQLFRDDTGTFDSNNGFMLRVTLTSAQTVNTVPEPGTMTIFALIPIANVIQSRRRRRVKLIV